VAAKKGLLHNVNRRKAAGTSRPKSRTTVSEKAYSQMQRNWGRKK
jgi:hypothetical protein